jgi:hypothetical protein
MVILGRGHEFREMKKPIRCRNRIIPSLLLEVISKKLPKFPRAMLGQGIQLFHNLIFKFSFLPSYELPELFA